MHPEAIADAPYFCYQGHIYCRFSAVSLQHHVFGVMNLANEYFEEYLNQSLKDAHCHLKASRHIRDHTSTEPVSDILEPKSRTEAHKHRSSNERAFL
jgi:hypothetical protein